MTMHAGQPPRELPDESRTGDTETNTQFAVLSSHDGRYWRQEVGNATSMEQATGLIKAMTTKGWSNAPLWAVDEVVVTRTRTVMDHRAQVHR